ncbi:hypothetical protein CC1G_14366 [Coprinopsis cinerea okayama7|uniref:Uncharacterized protein n=1 Tax=Coprinopsis cinerea (strain Okayama-7 / 130 / ATCC MYA-4618 / FGSC 9003) TaxID=240176 RepID=D6RM75_COPC7|nr:hypothetical protein CC1G_14366 [Coprinopsis cinerea okayama7\|eukprot:XP_002911367.1 hypothetical protein CC1G_14366 [Coprinopsis cinerea okayama7\
MRETQTVFLRNLIVVYMEGTPLGTQEGRGTEALGKVFDEERDRHCEGYTMNR